MKKVMRKIVRIDQDKCNGCGLCIPNCAEGAIRIIDGKARLAAENLCDGLGACLGKCPVDAITVEDRPADDFDEHAVTQHLAAEKRPAAHAPAAAPHGGCPGSAARSLGAAKPAASPCAAPAASQLGHWPVQLALAPVGGPMWRDADVLIAADCVPFALADFHQRLLAGKSLAIACPKLDDVQAHIEKLTAIFAGNSVRSVTVAHMEVPCCGGIVHAVQAALEASGRSDIEVYDVTVGIDGRIRRES
jgi:NAD-dependent dihydropyrimidine dehydrogenase PreA subunit